MPSFFLCLQIPVRAALISFTSQMKKQKLQGITTRKRLSHGLNEFLFYSSAQANSHQDKYILSGRLWKDLHTFVKSSRIL